MSRKPALWKLNPPKGHFAWSSLEEAAEDHQPLQRGRAVSHSFTDVATRPRGSPGGQACCGRAAMPYIAGATP